MKFGVEGGVYIYSATRIASLLKFKGLFAYRSRIRVPSIMSHNELHMFSQSKMSSRDHLHQDL